MNELNNKIKIFIDDYDLRKFKKLLNEHEELSQWILEDLLDYNFNTIKEFRNARNTIIRHYVNLAEAN